VWVRGAFVGGGEKGGVGEGGFLGHLGELVVKDVVDSGW